MHDYVHWHCSIDYCVKLSLVEEALCKKLLSISQGDDFSLIPVGKCATYGRAINRCNNFKLWQFWERPLYEICEYAFDGGLYLLEYLMKEWDLMKIILCECYRLYENWVNIKQIWTN